MLADALQENPQQTEAWFLLAHLVEPPERQARYLEYALHLDPDHAMAREHLERLRTPDVPPPVIKENSRHISSSSHATPPPTVDSEFSPIPPVRTNPVLSAPKVAEASNAAPQTESLQVVVEQNSSSIDTEWQRTAGKPKRAVQTPAPVVVPTPPPQMAQSDSATVTDVKQPPNKWLLAILVVMVGLAAFVLSFLAYTIFFQ